MLTGIGVFETIKYLLWKHNWLSARKADKHYGKEIVFEINNGNVIQVSPTPDEQAVNPITKVISSSKGIFIYLAPTSHIYIPDKALDTAESKAAIKASLRA